MINRGTPNNLEKYILVDSDVNLILHKNNFMPKYIDENGIYFLKNDEILKFMEKENLNVKEY